MNGCPMTQRGYNKLREELDQMESVELPALLERLAEARAEGDLRENAEYHGARESHGMLMAKIGLIKEKLASAQIIDISTLPKDEVVFGCTVKVFDYDFEEEITYTLVGAGEDNEKTNHILVTCPLAQGLIGKKVGDVAEIQVPAGLLMLKILDISFE